MPIVGYNLRKIEANRTDKKTEKDMQVGYSPKITKLEEADLGDVNKNGFKMEFEFTINFKPEVGKMVFEGDVIWVDDNAEEIIKKWKEEEKIPSLVSANTLNFLFRKCTTRAMQLSEDLALPPVLNYPRASLKVKKKDQKKSKGA